MTKKYIIKSPDGFTIEYTPYYTSKKKADTAFINWLKQFIKQNYYSTIKNGQRLQIPLFDIYKHCEFITTCK